MPSIELKRKTLAATVMMGIAATSNALRRHECKSSICANSKPSAVSVSPGQFVFERNSDLGAVAGIIGEVSHASNGPIVLETYNWGAARSDDLGQSWTYYDPRTFFPVPPVSEADKFCCDQIAYYDQNHDTMFWVLQYGNNITGNNAIRLAWAKGQDDLRNMRFCFTDFPQQQVGATG